MRRRTIHAGIAVVIIMALVFACMPPGTLKPIGEMSHKEKATFFMSVYNSQAEDYKIQAANPALAEEQRKILREKKKIMVQVYPLIKTYNSYVDAGAVPTPEVEQSIMMLINQLTATVISTIE